MRKHHTKNKGDLGVLKAQVDLCEQGFLILLPLTEHAEFDVVAYRNGEFFRIQVKYRSASDGKISVPMKTSWADKNGTHQRFYDKREIDIFCVYCPDTDECYYFDPNKFGNSVTLRVEAPKNNQKSNVKMASDYRRVP